MGKQFQKIESCENYGIYFDKSAPIPNSVDEQIVSKKNR